jgi:hypothetical protein
MQTRVGQLLSLLMQHLLAKLPSLHNDSPHILANHSRQHQQYQQRHDGDGTTAT